MPPRLSHADAIAIAKRGRKLLRAGRITHRQLVLLDALLWCCRNPAGQIGVSYTALMRLTHCARDTIAGALRVLERLGVLSRIGNPAGRPKGIEALARQHTEAAIRALVQALGHPKERVPAAVALLNRGWGLPKVAIETDLGPAALHLLAARLVGDELVAALERHDTIDVHADAEPAMDLLTAPPPLE
jgi:hypothetical protein